MKTALGIALAFVIVGSGSALASGEDTQAAPEKDKAQQAAPAKEQPKTTAAKPAPATPAAGAKAKSDPVCDPKVNTIEDLFAAVLFPLPPGISAEEPVVVWREVQPAPRRD